jgi:hypothetical protein
LHFITTLGAHYLFAFGLDSWSSSRSTQFPLLLLLRLQFISLFMLNPIHFDRDGMKWTNIKRCFHNNHQWLLFQLLFCAAINRLSTENKYQSEQLGEFLFIDNFLFSRSFFACQFDLSQWNFSAILKNFVSFFLLPSLRLQSQYTIDAYFFDDFFCCSILKPISF